MKLLVSLFLTVVCVHCIPLYDDDRTHVTETHTTNLSGYNGTARVGLGGELGYKNGTVVLKTDGNIGPEFLHYNESVVRTFDRTADVTPPPASSGSINCVENCTLIQPSNPSAVQNIPWAIPNSPLPMPYNSWRMPYNPWEIPNYPWANPYSPWTMPNNPWVTPNSPWVNPYSPFAMPNNPLAMQNSPWAIPTNPLGEPYNQWGIPNNQSIISKDAPDGTPSDMSLKIKPSDVSTTEAILL